MRYFLDTEFNGFCGDLISLALVPEDAQAPFFYEAIACADPHPWVAANVIPVLNTVARSRRDVAWAFAEFLGADGEPLIVADWPEDIAHAARLLVTGPGKALPVPPLSFQLIDIFDFDAAVASAVPHNAYNDAVALRARVLAREADLRL